MKSSHSISPRVMDDAVFVPGADPIRGPYRRRPVWWVTPLTMVGWVALVLLIALGVL